MFLSYCTNLKIYKINYNYLYAASSSFVVFFEVVLILFSINKVKWWSWPSQYPSFNLIQPLSHTTLIWLNKNIYLFIFFIKLYLLLPFPLLLLLLLLLLNFSRFFYLLVCFQQKINFNQIVNKKEKPYPIRAKSFKITQTKK